MSECIYELHYLKPITNKFLVTWFMNDNDTSLCQNIMTENGSSDMFIEILLQNVNKQLPGHPGG